MVARMTTVGKFFTQNTVWMLEKLRLAPKGTYDVGEALKTVRGHAASFQPLTCAGGRRARRGRPDQAFHADDALRASSPRFAI